MSPKGHPIINNLCKNIFFFLKLPTGFALVLHQYWLCGVQFLPSQHLISLHNLFSLRFSNRSYISKPTVILLLFLSQPKTIITLQRRFQTASPSCEVMVQTPILSSRRLSFSRYSSLLLLSIFAYLYAISISVCTPFSIPAENPLTLTYHIVMASSSTNPNPITALDDEDSLVHDFDHISIHSSTDTDAFCLIFKLLSPKPAKPSWIEKAMTEAWTLRFPCQISEYHSGLFLASFQCDGDRRRVLEEQPWHFDKFLMEFFPRLHPTPDAQDLQQAVDQFLHVDSPQSSPNPRISTQSTQFVSSSSTEPPNNTATTHVTPLFPVRPSAPIITDSISVSTNIDKSKGKAPMIVPTTRPSRKESGLVINDSCPPHNAAIPSVHRPLSLSPETPALFVDAAIDHHKSLTGAGFVFKRGHQTVLASQFCRLPGVVSPIFSEGQALLQSLKWCIDSQYTPQVVFSDCLNLVSKVNGDWQDNSALSGLASRIRLLFSNFPGASLQFLPRQFNVEAHNCAREALRSKKMGDKKKKATIFIRLVSAAGTGFFYVKKKPSRMVEKLEFRKFDPRVNRHVLFTEAKMK
ncbi:hypothetical protein F8388_002945 [Cannabis sativa]|uniref:50S ribosomal protein L33, chloroplastic n=2 Tax=Cannabis sativa TaxID=3483 RepID=A0A7J6GPD7_CANSA|nr:hypothetical protein G4B88_007091 [Cannabis sativa]KAF4390003.1 hypothetical protein F8388_002945 [Cannabis sativa]